jgi:predicted phosphodiesterase
LAKGLHDDGPAFRKLVYEGDGKNPEMIAGILDAFFASLAREKPDALIVAGDLTLNGEKASHAELASWFKAVEAAGVKVLVLPGNHDIANPWARAYIDGGQRVVDTVSAKEFERIYGAFGYAEAVSRDKASLSYCCEPVPGLRVMMLDTNRYGDNIAMGFPDSRGLLPPETREWIRRSADSARKAGARLVVAMHHSLIEHNPMVSRGYTIEDGEALAGLFASLGIDFVLSGHIHIQDIISGGAPDGRIIDIATNALSVFPHGYGTLRASGAAWRYRASAVDVEGWAAATGSQDARLLGFRAYSERFFKDRSEMMTRSALDGSGLSESQVASVVDTVGALNARFFAGADDIGGSPAEYARTLGLLEGRADPFLYLYAKSIASDSPPGDTDRTIEDAAITSP